MKRLIIISLCFVLLVACGTEETKSIDANIEIDSNSPQLLTYVDSDNTAIKTYQTQQHPEALPTENIDLLEKLKENSHKEIAEGIFQTVIKEVSEQNEGNSINFYTWEIKNGHLNLLDKQMYNDTEESYGYMIGEFYFQLWHDYKDFYLSYHDLQLNSSFLDVAKNGKMVNSSIELGTSMEELVSTVGEPTVIDWYNGGFYYNYNDIGFILDDNLAVQAINIPGNRINVTLRDVATILGKPSLTTVDELDNTIFYSYTTGNYILSFEGISVDKKVRNIWLNK